MEIIILGCGEGVYFSQIVDLTQDFSTPASDVETEKYFIQTFHNIFVHASTKQRLEISMFSEIFLAIDIL